MNEFFVSYITATGLVTLVGGGSPGTVTQQVPAPGHTILQVAEKRDDYWLNITTTPHILMTKITHPLTIGNTTIDADGEDECVIIGIHNPSTVIWPDGYVEVVTDGEIRFSVDLVGEYKIEIHAIPYLQETINVSAVTPA